MTGSGPGGQFGSARLAWISDMTKPCNPLRVAYSFASAMRAADQLLAPM